MSWNLQQINNSDDLGPTVPGESVACPQATAPGSAFSGFVCAFGDQLHFIYCVGLAGQFNIQDCWFDGITRSWNLQQINNSDDLGPTVPGVYVACPQATAGLWIGPRVSTFGNQQHFVYLALDLTIQDCWYDGVTGNWNLQQINNPGPLGVPGEFVACVQARALPAHLEYGQFVCAFGDQQHFAYVDTSGTIQDCWYDGATGGWDLQQINNLTQPPGPPAQFGLSACAFGYQLHVAYVDTSGNIQDCWYDASSLSWNLQQINNTGGQGPTVPGESVACLQATAGCADPAKGLSVCSFGDQLHVAYIDTSGNIQDCWYDASSLSWNLQQINGLTEPPGPLAQFGLSACAFGYQLHVAYVDTSGNIQDCWWESDQPSPEPNPCQYWIDQLGYLSRGDFETAQEYEEARRYFLEQLHECERAHNLPLTNG